jgi:hypothetical protein
MGVDFAATAAVVDAAATDAVALATHARKPTLERAPLVFKTLNRATARRKM